MLHFLFPVPRKEMSGLNWNVREGEIFSSSWFIQSALRSSFSPFVAASGTAAAR